MLNKLTGAQIIVKSLIDNNIEHVFGYPGGQVLDIYDELYKNRDRIKHIRTADEQGAAHAADGYARATGKTGVVIATSGPGATNLVTGIATAYLDSVPMVAITGNVACDMLGRDSFQEVDIMGITMPITKHNYIVKDADKLSETINEAFFIASSGRPGPVLIDVPKDVQTALSDKFGKRDFCTEKKSIDILRMKKAVEMIENAKRPYIFCGGGVVASDCGKEIMRLADLIDAPIGCSMMGLSAVPHSFERFLGMRGMHGLYASSVADAEADLVIAAGARFSNRTTGTLEGISDMARVIHIDIDPAEINKNVPAYLGITGDVKDVLEKLIEMTQKQHHKEWMDRVYSLKKYEISQKADKETLTPYEIIDCLNSFTDDDTLIATDVGQHQMWTAQRYKFEKNRTFISSGGLGTMGFGLGAAIGASIGTGKRAVLVTGDGSFAMNLAELMTAAAYKTPIVIIVMNNRALGMVKQWQSMYYENRFSETEIGTQPDFARLAEAFGIKGFAVCNLQRLEEAFGFAFKSDMPVVIDCRISSDEFVLPMMPSDGTAFDIVVDKDKFLT